MSAPWCPIASFAVWLAVASACAGDTAAVTRVALTLTDGSRLRGVCKATSLKVDWQGRELTTTLRWHSGGKATEIFITCRY
jgi:hypothetical protein